MSWHFPHLYCSIDLMLIDLYQRFFKISGTLIGIFLFFHTIMDFFFNIMFTEIIVGTEGKHRYSVCHFTCSHFSLCPLWYPVYQAHSLNSSYRYLSFVFLLSSLPILVRVLLHISFITWGLSVPWTFPWSPCRMLIFFYSESLWSSLWISLMTTL